MTQHHLAAGTRGLKIPVCCSEGGIQLQLQLQLQSPATVRQDALTLATTRPLGWDVPGWRKKKKERKKLGFPPQLRFFSREQRCLSARQQSLPSRPKVSRSLRKDCSSAVGCTKWTSSPVFRCAKSWLIVTNEIFFFFFSHVTPRYPINSTKTPSLEMIQLLTMNLAVITFCFVPVLCKIKGKCDIQCSNTLNPPPLKKKKE